MGNRGRAGTGQAFRDAATLVFLLLLALSVRFDSGEPVQQAGIGGLQAAETEPQQAPPLASPSEVVVPAFAAPEAVVLDTPSLPELRCSADHSRRLLVLSTDDNVIRVARSLPLLGADSHCFSITNLKHTSS